MEIDCLFVFWGDVFFFLVVETNNGEDKFGG